VATFQQRTNAVRYFQYVLTTTSPPQNNITITIHSSKIIIVNDGSIQRSKTWSSRLHSTCTLIQVTRDLLTVKIPDS